MSMDEFDFDIIPVKNEPPTVPQPDVHSPAAEHLGHAVADNLEKIIGIANSICEIKKMQVQSDAIIAEMRLQIDKLRVEADNYVKMKGADTNDAVAKMNELRKLINDINASPNNHVPPEVLSEIVNRLFDAK